MERLFESDLGRETDCQKVESSSSEKDDQPEASDAVRFTLCSSDGDQGYPGTLQVTATYSLHATPSADTAVRLCLDLQAELVVPGEEEGSPPLSTPVNLTQHSYFNLAGHASPHGILDHTLRLYCDAYTPVVDDDTLIPTREVRSVLASEDEDAVMDWTSSRSVRQALLDYGVERAGLTREQVEADLLHRDAPLSGGRPYGFDHNYVVRRAAAAAAAVAGENDLSLVAVLKHAPSGRRMTVRSTQPGVQLYTGNFLDNTLPALMKGDEHLPKAVGTPTTPAQTGGYSRWQSVCLEPQHFPDSILADAAQSPLFAAGQCPILTPDSPRYQHRIEYTFEFERSSSERKAVLSTAGFHGTDSDNNAYTSCEDMWVQQGVIVNVDSSGSESTDAWYQRAATHYANNCPPTIDGVLGGFAAISDVDMDGSRQFVRDLEIVRPEILPWSSG